MKTKLIRVYETDYETINGVRRALVIQNGDNQTLAEAVSHVLTLAQVPTEQVQAPAEQRQE